MKFTSPDVINTTEMFGKSVSIYGDYIVVGAYLHDHKKEDNTTLSNSGSAYLYKRNSDDNITLVKELIASDITSNQQFGYSVSISGDYIAVGAHTDNSYRGAVYLYKKDSSDNVVEVAKLSGSRIYGKFGATVLLRGNYLLISENHENTTSNSYLYEINPSTDEVTQIDVMTPSSGGIGVYADHFGLSMSDNLIVIGTLKDESAYIYSFDPSAGDPVTLIEKKVSAQPATPNEFGRRVSIIGDNIVISEPKGDSTTQKDTGFIHLYKPDANQP